MPLLNERAKELIAEYNRTPRCRERYNPAANAVYLALRECGDPFEPRFEHHIITGLKKFDMGRTMAEGFSTRLHCALQAIRRKPQIDGWQDCPLSSIDLWAHGSRMVSVYECLASVGTLDPRKQSHVAATKILHWLFPDLFLMLDSKVAGTFREFVRCEILQINATRLCRRKILTVPSSRSGGHSLLRPGTIQAFGTRLARGPHC
jgi:hypothetical protein